MPSLLLLQLLLLSAGLIRQRSTCQLSCEQAGRNNKLAFPPYAIHNMDIITKRRRHSIETDIVSVTASELLRLASWCFTFWCVKS
jgi:hypothetical protein